MKSPERYDFNSVKYLQYCLTITSFKRFTPEFVLIKNTAMTNILIVLVVIFFIFCQQKNKAPSLSTLNSIIILRYSLKLKKELNRDSNPLLKNISIDFFMFMSLFFLLH
ncbi:hypothetical protein [Flavobacterium sp. N2038]|uniref:hypothetical protein n=1 Tax=Flavobacterium sp. N2038 TaxID=2986829 RepID=UPI00222578DC|nr:hypothetical protein [Flavobacterium sp. N2038]